MPPYITWKEEYSVGVDRFDEQHRMLFDMINMLHETSQQGPSEESLHIVLNRLTEYADSHFGEEEAFMLENGFPEYQQHRMEHDGFVRQLSDFSEDLREEPKQVCPHLLEFLSRWIQEHLLKTDAKYAEFIREQDSALRGDQ